MCRWRKSNDQDKCGRICCNRRSGLWNLCGTSDGFRRCRCVLCGWFWGTDHREWQGIWVWKGQWIIQGLFQDHQERQKHWENCIKAGNQLSDLSGSRWKRRAGDTGIYGRWRNQDGRYLYLWWIRWSSNSGFALFRNLSYLWGSCCRWYAYQSSVCGGCGKQQGRQLWKLHWRGWISSCDDHAGVPEWRDKRTLKSLKDRRGVKGLGQREAGVHFWRDETGWRGIYTLCGWRYPDTGWTEHRQCPWHMVQGWW